MAFNSFASQLGLRMAFPPGQDKLCVGFTNLSAEGITA